MFAYSERYKPREVEVVTTLTAYDHPDGQTYIFVFNQALKMLDQEPSLAATNQMRSNGLVVDNCPKHLAPKDKPSGHCIYVPSHDLVIPLSLDGVILYMDIRLPTDDEIEKWSVPMGGAD